MNKKRLLALMVSVLLPSGIISGCNGNSENSQAESNNQVSELVPDDFRGMENSTGNRRAQEPGGGSNTADNNPQVAVNQDHTPPTKDKYDEKYMENPSAVRRAARNNEYEANQSGDRNINNVENPRGYVGKNIGTNQYTKDVLNAPMTSISEAEEEAVPTYLAYKNSELVTGLKGEATDYNRRLNLLRNQVKNADTANTYDPGLKKSEKDKGSSGIQKRLSEFNMKKTEVNKQLALLQKDKANNYKETRKLLQQEKSEFISELKDTMPRLQKQISSAKDTAQKQKLQQVYQLSQNNLKQLEKLDPSPKWDLLRRQTVLAMQNVNVKFDYKYQNKLQPEFRTGETPNNSVQ